MIKMMFYYLILSDFVCNKNMINCVSFHFIDVCGDWSIEWQNMGVGWSFESNVVDIVTNAMKRQAILVLVASLNYWISRKNFHKRVWKL